MKLVATTIGVLLAATSLASGQEGVSDGIIRLGISNDQSGPYADIGGPGSTIAAQLAIDDMGGKVLGAPIDIVVNDNQNKPDLASAAARQWFDTGKVDAVFDGGGSASALGILDVANNRKRMFFATGPATPRISGDSCSPYGFAWTSSTYALSKVTTNAIMQAGGNSWFFITADYTFGQSLEADATRFVTAAGGEIKGSTKTPLNTQDFSSLLLQAQASGADVVGLANTGTDLSNSVKQATEFGIVGGGQKIAALLGTITDIDAIGLDQAQGLIYTDPFYWDRNEVSRAFSKRFMEKSGGKAPTSVQAGTYSAVSAYLKAIAAAGTDDPDAVRAKLLTMKFTDPLADSGYIRADGRYMHEMLLVQVKTPAESKYPWDYLKILSTVPAEEAFNPLSESDCPMVKKSN